MTEEFINPDTRARIDRLASAVGPFAPELIYTRMDEVQARDIDWLWKDWLATGKLTILGGHPGDGKSTLVAALVAAFSSGGPLPDGSRAPVINTALLLAEDDLGDTVRPRLDLHGADTSRIIALEAVREPDGKDRFLNIGAHVDLIRDRIRDSDIGLLVIDPLTSFLPRTDRNSEGDIRDALMPLLQLAQDTGLAVIAVMHMGKGSGAQRTPLQQLLGSTAFGAMARVVWMVVKLPDQGAAGDHHSGTPQRLLGVVKSNISMFPPTLEWSRRLDSPIEWHGPSSISIEEALAGKEFVAPREDAKSFLREQLAGGMKPSRRIEEMATSRNISKKTLQRAWEELQIETVREGFQGQVWMKLPNSSSGSASGSDPPLSMPERPQ